MSSGHLPPSRRFSLLSPPRSHSSRRSFGPPPSSHPPRGPHTNPSHPAYAGPTLQMGHRMAGGAMINGGCCAPPSVAVSLDVVRRDRRWSAFDCSKTTMTTTPMPMPTPQPQPQPQSKDREETRRTRLCPRAYCHTNAPNVAGSLSVLVGIPTSPAHDHCSARYSTSTVGCSSAHRHVGCPILCASSRRFVVDAVLWAGQCARHCGHRQRQRHRQHRFPPPHPPRRPHLFRRASCGRHCAAS